MTDTKSIDELQAAVDAEKQTRTGAFKSDLFALLEKHKCAIIPQVVITGGELSTTLLINAE